MRIDLGSALLITFVLSGSPTHAASDSLESAAQDAPVREIQIVAGRFSFTPDTIEIAEGERVRFVVRSVDVAHGFAIETLGVRHEIPGDGTPVEIDFVASQAGTYQFECSVFCGTGHNRMTGTLTIVPATDQAQATRDTRGLSNTQSDFTVTTLPTTLPLPRLKGAFRLTHRFTRPLGRGDFGDLAEDFFGFDSSALIGLEYRFGLTSTTQAGVYRASNRTIQLFGQQQILRQADHRVGVDLLLSVEGTNNFRDEYAPAVGAVISRTVAPGTTLYVEPIWVGNTNISALLHPAPNRDTSGDNSTFMVGLGGRVRVRPSLYLVGEIIPRLAGFDQGDTHATFGIEKRLGGHGFQLNFSNSLGATFGQLARGASEGDWFIGFNITRQFF